MQNCVLFIFSKPKGSNSPACWHSSTTRFSQAFPQADHTDHLTTHFPKQDLRPIKPAANACIFSTFLCSRHCTFLLSFHLLVVIFTVLRIIPQFTRSGLYIVHLFENLRLKFGSILIHRYDTLLWLFLNVYFLYWWSPLRADPLVFSTFKVFFISCLQSEYHLLYSLIRPSGPLMRLCYTVKYNQ